jgi:DMSO/TMAO reductase YedYZ molybdopterin-dependent catalytic subunit
MGILLEESRIPNKTLTSLAISIAVLGTLTACSGSAETAGPSAGEVAVSVTGNVENEMAWTEQEVHSMDTIEAKRENNEGQMSTYTGVPIEAILEEAGVPDAATTVTFVSQDDGSADVELANVRACDDCIVSFRNNGGFSIVMPGYRRKLQVKGVVEIRIE